jgi:hypothetical protein
MENGSAFMIVLLPREREPRAGQAISVAVISDIVPAKLILKLGDLATC